MQAKITIINFSLFVPLRPGSAALQRPPFPPRRKMIYSEDMTEPKLKSKLWLQAAIRLCANDGIPATIVRKGDPDAGVILVKMNQLDLGCTVLTQVRDADGALAWMRGTGAEPVAEEKADAYIERQKSYDPDLWVIEVEDRQGRMPFGGKII